MYLNNTILISVMVGTMAIIGTISIGIVVHQTNQYTFQKEVKFSMTQYPELQKKIARMITKNTESLIPIKPSHIGISLQDLNDDGTPEIITFLNSVASGYSGIIGGYTGIYKLTKTGLFLIQDNRLTDGYLFISSHKTNGYHDILSMEGTRTSQITKHTLAWIPPNGYMSIQSEPVSEKEKNFIRHIKGTKK